MQKVGLYQRLLDVLLALEDTLQERRVAAALSPSSAGEERGLIGIIHDSQRRSPRNVITHIKYLLSLSAANAAVADFLNRQHTELLWMESFLKSEMDFDVDKLEAAAGDPGAPGGPGTEMQVIPVEGRGGPAGAKDAPGPSDDGEGAPGVAKPGLDKWRKDSTYMAYVAVKKMLGDGKAPAAEGEVEELRKEVARLRLERMKILAYYNMLCPDIPPPTDEDLCKMEVKPTPARAPPVTITIDSEDDTDDAVPNPLGRPSIGPGTVFENPLNLDYVDSEDDGYTAVDLDTPADMVARNNDSETYSYPYQNSPVANPRD